MHKKNLIMAGSHLEDAERVLIMIHGRGAAANDIISLADYLKVDRYALIAPQATNNSWYPNSFLMPSENNEPWLSSAIELLGDILRDLNSKSISSEKIYILGFSQGACLALEFSARNATRYGGIIAFTGGLIGEKINYEYYNGDFNYTPIFIGTSDPDMHVPIDRVNMTSKILQKMNANVILKVYKNMGHTINLDELNTVNELILSK
ncbi:MAG: dienelactone hydrolase family protein [Bacteroidota bacterium]|nr:dienelactone hydrolase family protein [Bacteroidota bacterium]MDP4196497.1 dienelactone hydrolase family protein [Bacteroidota bacterium]